MTVSITAIRLQILQALPSSTESPTVCSFSFKNRLTKAQKELHLQALHSVGLISPPPTITSFGSYIHTPDAGSYLSTTWTRTPVGDLSLGGRSQVHMTRAQLTPVEMAVFTVIPVYSSVPYSWANGFTINLDATPVFKTAVYNLLSELHKEGLLVSIDAGSSGVGTLREETRPRWALDLASSEPRSDGSTSIDLFKKIFENSRYCAMTFREVVIDWSVPRTFPEIEHLLLAYVGAHDAIESLIRKGMIVQRACHGGGLGQTIRVYTESYICDGGHLTF